MYNKEQIETLRREARQLYKQFYSSKGFTCNKPLPLRIHYDPSLSFVNCTICHFKKSYFGGEELISYCVTQPALRTNTYKIIHTKDELKYTASLEMLGAFSVTNKESVCNEFKHHMIYQAEFLNRYMNAESCFLVIVSPSIMAYLTEDFIKHLKANNTEVLFAKDELHWDYRIDGITGIGTNWMILRYGVQYEFGNVIILYKDGVPIGVESGGSIELLLQSKCHLPHKIYANTYCNEWVISKINEKENLAIKYFDTLDVIAHILWSMRNYENVSLKLLVVLEQYIRALKCIMYIEKMKCFDLKEDIKHLEPHYEGWRNCPEELYQTICRELDNQWDMSLIVRNHNKRNCRKNVETWRGLSELEKAALGSITN